MSEMEKHLERLEELVKDEDKIVTISSFAKEQNVSVIDTRSLFDKFVEKNKNLGVTYVLNGLLQNGKGKGVYLLKDVDLGKTKNIFEGEPKKSIYSVQKSINIDYNVISLVDKFSENNINEKPLLGSVVGKNCIKREIKRKVLPPPPAPVVKGKSSFFTKQKSEEKNKNEENENKKEKTVESPKIETKTKPKNNIASMFSKAASNKQPSKEEKTNSNVKKSKPTNGLASFLSRNNSSNSSIDKTNKIEEKSLSEESKITVSSENSENLVNSEDFEEPMECEEIEKPVVKKEEKKEKKKPKRARSRSRENTKSSKRRKRIVEMNDSDSDDIFASEKDENIIENSDEERPHSPVTKKPLAPKNKKRIVVEKTYEDDEGFIVTKEEIVYETPSEDEAEEIKETPKKEEIKKNPAPKVEKKNNGNSENEISPKKGGKKNKKEPLKNQPTLMNFFKRK